MNDQANQQRTQTTAFTDKVGELKRLVQEICSAAPGAAEEQLSQLSELGGKLASVGKEKACAAGREVVSTVKKHPYESAAIAVGTGLLVWWLMRRKSSMD